MTTVTTDARWQAIGYADRAAAKIPTAPDHTLRSILAELNTGGDTPIYDALHDPVPDGLVDRVLAAVRKVVRRGN